MQIYDIHDDAEKLIYSVIDKENDVPGFVKSASFEPGDTGRNAKQLFAWPEEKRFPLDTPADVYMSYQYFNKTASAIPPALKLNIAREIGRAIEWGGVPVDTKIKAASAPVKYEIPNESFALRVKTASLHPDIVSKNTHRIQDGELVMYPLNTPGNIKTANDMFPRGLDGDFKGFRGFVAMEIARRVDPEALNPVVADYLPLPKSAALDQLDMRAGLFPDFATGYLDLKSYTANPYKFASIMDALDTQSGAAAYYSKGLYEPLRFINGFADDTLKPEYIRLGNTHIEKSKVEKFASELDEIIPGFKDALPDVNRANALIESQPKAIQSVFIRDLYSLLG